MNKNKEYKEKVKNNIKDSKLTNTKKIDLILEVLADEGILRKAHIQKIK